MGTSPRIILRTVDDAAVARLAEELPVSELLARIFVGRGLMTAEDCKKFFTIDIAHLHDPFLFKGMQAAVERISKAIDNKDKSRSTVITTRTA
jgi:single-stranded-DNA-specific exonuclease